MKAILAAVALGVLGVVGAADGVDVASRALPPLPAPVSNNAIVTVQTGHREFVTSFAGLGAGRSHTDTLAATYLLEGRTGEWREAEPLPALPVID